MAEEGGLPTCRLSLVDEEVSKEERQMKDGGSSAFHKIPVIVVISVQFPFSKLMPKLFSHSRFSLLQLLLSVFYDWMSELRALFSLHPCQVSAQNGE